MEKDVHKQLSDELKAQMMMLWSLLFFPRGRIGRRHYNVFFFFVLLPTVILFKTSSRATPSLLLIGIVVLWATSALQVKRWHDRNKTGWWLLVNFIPIMGPAWAIISCCCLRGTDGANKYGPPYKGMSGLRCIKTVKSKTV